MDETQHTAASPIEPRDSGPERFSYREPGILRYLRLLWEHRWLILGGSLLPALVVGVILSLWPRRYAATFVYERPLAEREYSVLQRRFYSQENLDKIAARLREQGLTSYVQKLDQARAQQSFERLIRFDVTPMYPRRLQTTDPCTSEKISAFKAKLLSIKVVGDSEEEVAGVSAVVTGNFESILPLYDVRNHLQESLQKLRDDAAKIEGNRFTLSLGLQKEKAKLEKFKSLQDAPGEAAPGNFTLQFNVETTPPLFPVVRVATPKGADLQELLGNGAEKKDVYGFLPLSYQIRAA
jgi:LPS O-antigen subunit length determinant protein (WzzB/FepE family)